MAHNATTTTYTKQYGQEKASVVFTTTAAEASSAATSYSEGIPVPPGASVKVLSNWTSAEIALTIQGMEAAGGVESIGGIGADPTGSGAAADAESWVDLDLGALVDNTAETFHSCPKYLRVKAVATDAGSDGVAAEAVTVDFWYGPTTGINSGAGFSISGNVGADPS